ncbi:phospholipase C, phosphocholine-specific [Komagataeibacter oboediens]|uniref:phosphocholine-specific phospholipase C n=1 Tax=Komagataeibacter oboediens TaxID=65958 RepID=UPI001C2BDC00|nr:phospholipase C, phosphocholine-specific [Komagataeibacter oboediens]MBV0888741.1 phospholipase C, phosphocholine-specific [Komagataeibacter oboediens]MCK9821266.1 phospholipase C, phosphocholine-specific [Komagataeibacter oboediens]
MPRISRRSFLKGGAGSAMSAMLMSSINRALAIPASRRTGTIEDVEHVVVFMQENRSFDHYYGHLNGVRGINDRHPVLRPDGRPVWFQPRLKAGHGDILPFHLDTRSTSAQCVVDLDHSWKPTHAAINAGRNDRWPPNKTDMTMGYYTRDDIPFHYALADAFTVCDHYFCSTPTQTHPNRFYLMTGMVDAEGTGGGPILDNIDWVDRAAYGHVPPPFTWTTYPERLEKAGVSWQVYQQGLEGRDLENGNFGTNILMNFRNFVHAPEGSSLHARAMTRRTLDDLRADVLAHRLPQVSWLLPPAAYSEHPRWTPDYGAAYIARILDALTADPDVWSKTVLLLMYDENDGYFDHMPPPQPPTPVLPGRSTVSTRGEIHNRLMDFSPQAYTVDNLPYGLGPRVPMLAISPWSTGGFVCSDVFDHTSVIRFITARFGVDEPNITPWRRSVCGDLTTAFDFSAPGQTRLGGLPDTRDYREKVEQARHRVDPAPPARSVAGDMGIQESGTRPLRPTSYDLAVNETMGTDAGALVLEFSSHGALGACFYVYHEHTDDVPRRHTVGAGDSLTDTLALSTHGVDVWSVTGPNGFLRRFHRVGPSSIRVAARHVGDRQSLVLELTNHSDHERHVRIHDNAYHQHAIHLTVPAGATIRHEMGLAASSGWYDFSVSVRHERHTLTQLAGLVPTGAPGITDPAATSPVLRPLKV